MRVEASQGGPEAPTPPGTGHTLQGLSSLQKLGGCHLHFLQFHLAGFHQGVARCHDELSISRQGVQAPSNQSLQTQEVAGWVFPRSLSPSPSQAIAGPPWDAVQCLPSPLTSRISRAMAGAGHPGVPSLGGASSGRDPGVGLLSSGTRDCVPTSCPRCTEAKTHQECWSPLGSGSPGSSEGAPAKTPRKRGTRGPVPSAVELPLQAPWPVAHYLAGVGRCLSSAYHPPGQLSLQPLPMGLAVGSCGHGGPRARGAADSCWEPWVDRAPLGQSAPP